MTRLVLVLASVAALPALASGQYRQSSYCAPSYSASYYPSYGYYSSSYGSYGALYQGADGYYYYSGYSTPYIRTYNAGYYDYYNRYYPGYYTYIPYSGYSASYTPTTYADAKTAVIKAGVALAKQQQDQKDLEATIRLFPALQTMPQAYGAQIGYSGYGAFPPYPANGTTFYGYTQAQTYNGLLNQQATVGGGSDEAVMDQLAAQSLEYAKSVSKQRGDITLAKVGAQERFAKRLLMSQTIVALHERTMKALLSPTPPDLAPVEAVPRKGPEKLVDPKVDASTGAVGVGFVDDGVAQVWARSAANCAQCHFKDAAGGRASGKFNLAAKDYPSLSDGDRKWILDHIDPSNPARDMPRVIDASGAEKMGEPLSAEEFAAWQKVRRKG